jgi:UDP-N-acetylmuramyl pentapeptide phosphotransferase/UDP-N-acetylglucosamine-1-phosphate transferase
VAGAAAARAAYAGLRRRAPGGTERWARTNHRGEPVTLLEGPAAAAGAIAAALAVPGLPGRTRAALALAAAGAAGFGCYDDLAGSGKSRGFRGHLTALAHGEVTSGMVKLAGIGATGAVASALLGGPAVDKVINTGLVAGSANLLNLFDLRPGRASKVTLAWAALLAAGSPAVGRARGQAARSAAAAAVGPALALLPEDLGERAMLGDAGANALGALLGAAVAAGLPRSARLAVLAGVVGLTAASEKVSFTKVIARTPALNKLDMLGRRPPAPAPAKPAPAGSSGAGPSGAGPSGAGPSAAEAAAVANAETGPIPVVDPARPTAVP